MLKFKSIAQDDVKTFMKHWDITLQRSSDYCFAILWGWADDYGYETAWDGKNDLFWVRQTKPEIYNMAPVGNWQRDDWQTLLRKYYGDKAVFWLVPEELVKIWQEQFPFAMSVEEDRGNWEYLYDIHALAELKGGNYVKKRNHINSFIKNHNYDYKPICAENRERVLAFQKKWLSESEGYLPGIRQEHDCICRILDSWGKIPHLHGGLIEIGENIVAYTIGEKAGDSLLIHFEKALADYAAGYQVIHQQFLLEMLKMFPELVTVNREEDLNDEGIRESKLSYHPNGFIKKYKVTLNFK